jgi:hypothetical protein
MATVHLYHEGKEVASRTLVLKRHVNIESVFSWWKAARKALTGKEVPLEYEKVEVDTSYIRFECADGTIVMVDRKRAML